MNNSHQSAAEADAAYDYNRTDMRCSGLGEGVGDKLPYAGRAVSQKDETGPIAKMSQKLVN